MKLNRYHPVAILLYLSVFVAAIAIGFRLKRLIRL